MWPTDILIKKYPLPSLVIALVGMFVVAPIVSVAIDKGWLRRKAIEVKYCYHWDGDTIRPFWVYEKGKRIKCFENAYWMLAYYYIPDSLFPDKNTDYFRFDFNQQNRIYKVEVLRYSEDSLLVTIRYNYPTSGSYAEQVEVVPTFTLHDTLPIGYEAENEGYMKDIKLKKSKS